MYLSGVAFVLPGGGEIERILPRVAGGIEIVGGKRWVRNETQTPALPA